MTGDHVGKQTDRQAHGTRKKGKDLDRDQQRGQCLGGAGGHEMGEELRPLHLERHDDREAEHHQRQRQRHGDMAGEGKGKRQQAEVIAGQDEEEQREHEREEGPAFRTNRINRHVVDEVVAHFCRGLQPARHHRRGTHAHVQECQNHNGGNNHHHGGLAEPQGFAKCTQNWMELELTERVDG